MSPLFFLCFSPPYRLDFAGVLQRPPDFEQDTVEKWRAKIDWVYGPNSWIAHAVHEELAKHGSWSMDFRPSNMNLKGLPGLEPIPDDSESDDF